MKPSSGHPTYIWQRPDWPDFKWNSEKLMDNLATVNQLHGLLSGTLSTMGIAKRNHNLLASLSDELINSSEIEGVILHPESVRSSIARKLGLKDDGTLAEDHYIEGLVDVMLDAISRCEFPLTSERFFNWHAALFPTGRSGMYKIAVGEWRQGETPMQVVSGAFGHEKVHFEAPGSDVVEGMMSRMMEWCNNAHLSPFIMSAVAHLWFVTIHPFDDGNGRISRTLSDMFLARIDTDHSRYYSVSAEINRRKKEYYDILERTQKGCMDITEWIKWYLDIIEDAIRHSLEKIEVTLRKSAYWDGFRDIEINERQRKVVNRLWDGFEGKLTTSKWARICHCSQDTALRDINDLIAKGMLRKSDSSGRSAHYLLPD